MSQVQPIIEIESYVSMLRQLVETAKKVRVFTKNNQENFLDDSSLDFTKNINKNNSNTYNLHQGIKSQSLFCSLLKRKKTLKNAAKVINERLDGHLCSKSVFNLSKKVFTETEIEILALEKD